MPAFKDLTGQVFGRLTVINRPPTLIGSRKTRWLCRCECGIIKEILSNSLTSGSSKSCGCLKRELTSVRFSKNLTGRVFFRWIVISRVENDENDKSRWLCRCDCGVQNIVTTNALLTERSKSCGCWNRDSLYMRFEADTCLRKHLYMYKRNAKKRGLCFALDEHSFCGLVYANCFYCGHEPTRRSALGVARYHVDQNQNYFNGIDREDNSKGYTLDNVVTCCSFCNYAKNTKSKEEFIQWLDETAEYRMKLKRAEDFLSGNAA